MLTAEQNDELTDLTPGTPMGELLRRYWYPVAFTRQLAEFPVKHARLLGEDWALFKTASGRYGIVPEACPHRRASLAYGVVESDGIRCPYHGWLFGVDGEC
ncbi:MAG: Rieske 2Fe-2S domain-containing protein, partial [Streptosporangiaceae bacterium]